MSELEYQKFYRRQKLKAKLFNTQNFVIPWCQVCDILKLEWCVNSFFIFMTTGDRN